MQSPEKIDEYIRVSTPKAWILVAALALIAAGVLVWGFVGSIPKTFTTDGVMKEEYGGRVVCLLPIDIAGQYLMGHEANITLPEGTSLPGTVASISDDPLSYEEVSGMIRSDWRLQAIWGKEDTLYQYVVEIDCGEENTQALSDRELLKVSVVLSDVRPIEYVMN